MKPWPAHRPETEGNRPSKSAREGLCVRGVNSLKFTPPVTAVSFVRKMSQRVPSPTPPARYLRRIAERL